MMIIFGSFLLMLKLVRVCARARVCVFLTTAIVGLFHTHEHHT